MALIVVATSTNAIVNQTDDLQDFLVPKTRSKKNPIDHFMKNRSKIVSKCSMLLILDD